MKNKGFTMVEVLGVIVILGILSTITVTAYSRYKEQSSRKAFNILSENAASAAENYFMDNLNAADEVSLETLQADDYLENLIDPWDNSKRCTGTVTRLEISKKAGDSIDMDGYRVELRCTKDSSCREYPDNKKCSDGTGTDQGD